MRSHGLDFNIKLDKADIEKTIILNRFDQVGETKESEKTHSRRVFLTIKGSVKDILRYDYLAFQNNKSEYSEEDTKLISEIKIIITMCDNDSDYLHEEPSIYVDEYNILQIYNLNFKVDQFTQIESTLNDKFTRIKAILYKKLSKDEIKENSKKDDSWFSFNDDYGDLDYTIINKDIDGKEKKILYIKNHQNNIKLNHFRIYSSKPKFVKNEDWVDDVWSLEHKMNQELLDDEVTLLDEIKEERNNFPKHIFNEIKKVNLLFYIIIFLLIVLIIKT